MKKLLLLPAACLVLFGCVDKKAQEQSLMDSVIAVHQKDMGTDEQLLKNKAAIECLVKNSPAGVLTYSVKLVIYKAVMADSAMDVWMHNFNADADQQTARRKHGLFA